MLSCIFFSFKYERKKNMIKITENKRKRVTFADIAPPLAHAATTVFVMSCFANKDPDGKKKNEPYILNVNIYFHSSNDQIQ